MGFSEFGQSVQEVRRLQVVVVQQFHFVLKRVDGLVDLRVLAYCYRVPFLRVLHCKKLNIIALGKCIILL